MYRNTKQQTKTVEVLPPHTPTKNKSEGFDVITVVTIALLYLKSILKLTTFQNH